MTLEQIADALQDVRPEAVAAETGLAASTVYKYRAGKITDPPLQTVRILSDYLNPKGEG